MSALLSLSYCSAVANEKEKKKYVCTGSPFEILVLYLTTRSACECVFNITHDSSLTQKYAFKQASSRVLLIRTCIPRRSSPGARSCTCPGCL